MFMDFTPEGSKLRARGLTICRIAEKFSIPKSIVSYMRFIMDSDLLYMIKQKKTKKSPVSLILYRYCDTLNCNSRVGMTARMKLCLIQKCRRF